MKRGKIKLTKEQQRQLVQYASFIAGFVQQLHDKTALSGDLARQVSQEAACVWLAVEHVQTEDEEINSFVVALLQAAIKHFYGTDRQPVPDIFQQVFKQEN
jgi:hypothetical protein